LIVRSDVRGSVTSPADRADAPPRSSPSVIATR
jgi:hypothetical protein